MKKYIGILLMSLFVASCAQQEMYYSDIDSTFYAEIEQPAPDDLTKTYYDTDSDKVLWDNGDLLTLFTGTSAPLQYEFVGGTGVTGGRLILSDNSGASSGDAISQNYAVYPYSEDNGLDGNEKIVIKTSGIQTYPGFDSFGENDNIMVAASDNTSFSFKNVCGWIILGLSGEGQVSSITLSGNNDEIIAGDLAITATVGGDPTVAPRIKGTKFTNLKEITLTCPDPVTLSSTATDFWIAVPPTIFSNGFTFTVTDPDGRSCTKSISFSYEVQRAKYRRIATTIAYPAAVENIVFADETVKAICVENWDIDGDEELSFVEAAAINSLMVNEPLNRGGGKVNAFAGSDITTFDELTFFTGLNAIEDGAFENCIGLKSISIPKNVGIIGDNAFSGCSSLESVTITSIIPPEIGENAFTNTNNCPIFVSENVVEEYANEWSEYANRIAFFVEPKVFPDENFRAFIFNYFDTNKDGLLSEAECDAVTSIDVDTKNISSLQGIEYFVNLEDLFCRLNNWSTLKKYFNTETHEWHTYDANDNEVIGSLSSLDVSSNTSLKRLYCIGNQLTSIDVSNNTALTVLNCSYNQIESLNVSNNVALTYLDCSYNKIESLNVSNNVALAFLSCSLNYVESLDVSNNTALTTFYCDYNQLGSIDVSNNSALTAFSCRSTQLETIDVSNNTSLSGFWCDYNQLISLDVRNNVLLTQLYCENNQLTSLDVSNNTLLATLYCKNSTMQYLYLAEGQKINRLYKNAATEIVYKGVEP